MIADILGGEERAMDATGNAADVRLPPLAWKTGTSSGFHDAWTIAFNPDYVIGVWVGNPDGGSSDLLVGKKVAAPVVWEIFRRIYPDNDGPWFERPAGIVKREVCGVSGLPAGPNCKHIAEDWGIAGVSRFANCTVHARGPDASWPAEVATFLQRQEKSKGTQAAKAAQIRITSPAAASEFRMFDGISNGVQRLSLAAASSDASQQLHWFVNNAYLGEARAGENLFWPLQRGRHRIVCCDANGHSDRIEIAVE